MRRRRSVSAAVAAALVAVTGPVMVSGAAEAGDAIRTEPFSAFTLEGSAGSYVLSRGGVEDTSPTVSVPTEMLDFEGESATGQRFSGRFMPPSGSSWQPGTTYENATVYTGYAGRGCSQGAGTVTVHETGRNEDGSLSSFAASYQSPCGDFGELRWNSTMSYERFGSVQVGSTSAPRTVTFAGTGATFGSASLTPMHGTPASFRFRDDTCSGTEVPAGETCAVTIDVRPASLSSVAAQVALPSPDGEIRVPLSANTRTTTAGAYTAVPPTRILDTRIGKGVGSTRPVGAGQTVRMQVAGRGHVPKAGASAVVFNLTSTAATRNSFFTAWPNGKARPGASSLNFRRGETRANLVTVPIGRYGKVNLFNKHGSAHMVADVVGYYRTGTNTGDSKARGSYYPFLQPERLLDTRDQRGGLTGPGTTWTVWLDYGASFDPSTLTAVALNVTAIKPNRRGYLKAWNGTSAEPGASSLNYDPGTVTPNMAVVPVATCWDCGSHAVPSFAIKNYGANTHLAVDVVGVYDDGRLEGAGQGSSRYRPLVNPVRIVDSRSRKGASLFRDRHTQVVTPPAAVADYDTFALASNLTSVTPTRDTYLTLWPDLGNPRPKVSNLNAAPGAVVANMAQFTVGRGNRFNIFNALGLNHVLVDVSGSFQGYPPNPQQLPVAHARPSRRDAASQPVGGFAPGARR